MHADDTCVLAICDTIRETSFAKHQFLRSGLLEKIYVNAFYNRLSKLNLKVILQAPLQVLDEDGTVLGDYFADLFVEDCLIVEVKTCKSLADEHTAQLFGYLRAARLRQGLLINFGARELQIKKYVLD